MRHAQRNPYYVVSRAVENSYREFRLLSQRHTRKKKQHLALSLRLPTLPLNLRDPVELSAKRLEPATAVYICGTSLMP